MAYLEMLARDYDLWAALAPEDTDTTEHELDARTARVFQAVLLEIEQATVFTAVSMSVTTALLTNNTPAVNPWHLQTYGPARPQIYPLVAAKLLSSSLGTERLAPVQNYFARLEFAQRLSQTILGLDPALDASARLNEFEKLEDAWRYTCRASLEANDTIRICLSESGFDEPPAVNANGEALLRAAERGEQPCVDRDGNVTVPGWAENRQAKRVAVNLPAIAYYRGLKQTVVIDNASKSGLGLAGLDGAIPGRMISLAVEGGETLSGMIIWSRGKNTGIKLDETLSDDHRLLRGKAS